MTLLFGMPAHSGSMWKSAKWTDGTIESDDFLGGTKVRLTYPDGNVVIGKITVEPNLRLAGARGEAIMARITTPHSGDTWMNVADADIQVWASDAFEDALTPR